MRILIFLLFFGIQAMGQTISEYKSTGSIAIMEQNAHARLASREQTTTASNNFDVNYYRCEWEVDPAANYINGTVTAYFHITANTNSISFDLVNTLVADSVKQRNSLLTFTQANNTLSIDFPATINAGALDSVSIYYKGAPAGSGFGSFIQTTHAGAPVIWTLSEPYGARDWWPCRNGLDDKIDSIDIFITNPAAYKAASNGLLQWETLIDGGTKKLTYWKHRYPIATYLVCMAVTNFSVFTDNVQLGPVNLPMVTYCYPENLTEWQTGTQNTLDAMVLFHNHFGDYPFIKEKYGHVQFGWGGGMEHQTATFVINVSEGLTAHELGHQWFGDKITCRSWEDIWLNEGFATYLARFYMEDKYPATVLTNRQAVLNDITSLPNGSVKVDDTTSVGRIFSGRLTYNKGSYLVNMLRFKLGDSIFFRGIRRYQQDPSIKYGFAVTADLQRNLETESGQDLTKFFDQWFVNQGFPSYHIQWSSIGSSNVKIKVEQTTSDPSVTFFEMPVPLTFKNATMEKTIVVDNKMNGESFIKYLGFIPDTVYVDQQLQIISKNNSSAKVPLANSGNPAVEVYPNPVQDPFTLYLHDFTEPQATMLLYNMSGQLVQKQLINLINGSEIIYPSLGRFARGQYILKITSGNFIFTKAILK